MSVRYQAVLWNPQKVIYDRTLLGGLAVYLALFVGVFLAVQPDATIETVLIRAFGTAAILLLHVILSIGPLARIDSRFLPLLYNRRHLGVTMFVLALTHAVMAIIQFHTLGDTNPLVSVLTSNPRFDSLSQFPFQPLGLVALVILFLMAATSHDFWLANLSAPVWKALHMMVYLAYALLVMHIALGILQAETSPLYPGLLGGGLLWIIWVHLVAASRERAIDEGTPGPASASSAPFVEACAVDEIVNNRARVVVLEGERVAIFRYDGKISAVSAVCQHQNGPLGEGKVIDGCITCPWHGYQYIPGSGRSPEPFTERIPTFHVKVEDGRVWVDPRPNPPGTPVEPANV